MYSTIKLSADQSQWQEAPAFPVGISHMESIVLGDKKAVLFFGGQSSYLTYRDNLSAPQYVHAAIPHLYMYYPSKQLVKLQGFLDAGLGAAKYVSPMYTTHDEEYRLWLQGGEKERDNVLSPPYVDSVYRVEGTINYKDTLLHRFSSMDTTLTARRPIVDSLGKNEAKMLLIPIIDGGLTNLKMNIIGAAEIAYKNSMVLVLPELILDWTVARRKELAANVTILSINRCGTNVKCGSFEDFFDTDTFINTCKKLGIDVIRNELPREVLDLPSKLIETKDRAAMDASGSFFYFPYLELCSDGCQAFIYGDEHYYPDLHNAYEQKKKYTFIGVSPYWFINSFTATDIARRNILINEAFLPSKKLGDLVSSVRQRLPEKYHCLHLRIEQDLRIHCTMADYKDDLDCYLSAEVIYERLKEHYKPGDTVYVATGKTLDSDAALAMFANTYKIIRKEEVIPNIAESLEDSRELLGMIDHEICLYSDVFVGSKTSSFSFWVGAWRNMRRMKWAYYNPLFKNNKDPLTGRITNYTHNTEFTKFKIEDSFIGG